MRTKTTSPLIANGGIAVDPAKFPALRRALERGKALVERTESGWVRLKGIKRDVKGKQLGNSDLFTLWGIRKHLLDDLYVRFFRLAELRIGERAEFGVVSFISNSSYLAGRSHPIMRESLLQSFPSVWIDNLNGDKYKTGKVIPKGLPGAWTADQSIFTTEYDVRGIQVGTCISTLLKRGNAGKKRQSKVHYRDFWGKAELKREALLASLDFDSPKRAHTEKTNLPKGVRSYAEIHPTKESRWKLIPRSTGASYEDWAALDELFPITYQGVNPNRGLSGSVIDTSREALTGRMRDYYSASPFSEFRQRHPVICEPRAEYDPQAVRDGLRKTRKFSAHNIVPYVVFPMDVRWIYFEPDSKLLNRSRPELWENLKENEFLIAVPQPRKKSESRLLSGITLFDLHLHDRGSVCFPAHVLRKHGGTLFSPGEERFEREANLSDGPWSVLSKAWKIGGKKSEKGALTLTRELFHICLAIGHAPQFESDHQESLAQDWAHVPIPKSRAVAGRVTALGSHVAALLDPTADAKPSIQELLGSQAQSLGHIEKLDKGQVRKADLIVQYSYFGAAAGGWRERPLNEGETLEVGWGSSTGDLYLNDHVCFRHVPAEVWRYELGGYPVLKKWLGYRDAGRRPGEPLTFEEVDHFCGMVRRIAAILLLGPRLDAEYEKALADCFTAEELKLR